MVDGFNTSRGDGKEIMKGGAKTMLSRIPSALWALQDRKRKKARQK